MHPDIYKLRKDAGESADNLSRFQAIMDRSAAYNPNVRDWILISDLVSDENEIFLLVINSKSYTFAQDLFYGIYVTQEHAIAILKKQIAIKKNEIRLVENVRDDFKKKFHGTLLLIAYVLILIFLKKVAPFF